jgi:hypothetical protein
MAGEMAVVSTRKENRLSFFVDINIEFPGKKIHGL